MNKIKQMTQANQDRILKFNSMDFLKPQLRKEQTQDKDNSMRVLATLGSIVNSSSSAGSKIADEAMIKQIAIMEKMKAIEQNAMDTLNTLANTEKTGLLATENLDAKMKKLRADFINDDLAIFSNSIGSTAQAIRAAQEGGMADSAMAVKVWKHSVFVVCLFFVESTDDESQVIHRCQ
jgi:hypothetical protein